MKKVLFCTPYEGISNKNIGGISVWAKAVVAHYEQNAGDVELIVQPLDRKTYVRGVNAFVRLWSGVAEYLELVKIVKRRLQKEHFDAVHLCTTASLGLIKDFFILRYAKSKNISTFLHFHCGRIPVIMKNRNWETKLLNRVMRYTDVPVVMDNSSLQALRASGIASAVNLPNPLSTFVSETVDALKPAIERVGRRLVFVGHVVDIKGVYELVEACSRMSDVELRMVGHVEDNVRNNLEAIALKRSGEWLTFMGGLSREDTLREILSADILVAPSYFEGFPNVILEAMACGTPIVASCVGAIPEMLDNGNCGVLIEPRSAEAVYEAVTGLLNNENMKQTFAARALKRVKDMYAMPSVWKRMVNIWNGEK